MLGFIFLVKKFLIKKINVDISLTDIYELFIISGSRTEKFFNKLVNSRTIRVRICVNKPSTNYSIL
jgi:hypothetical protein